jgi:hypothetical protein
VNTGAISVEDLIARGSMQESPELRVLFHRLNNQLGIIIANAELLESKATDDKNRARAAQVVASTLDAMEDGEGNSPSRHHHRGVNRSPRVRSSVGAPPGRHRSFPDQNRRSSVNKLTNIAPKSSKC